MIPVATTTKTGAIMFDFIENHGGKIIVAMLIVMALAVIAEETGFVERGTILSHHVTVHIAE